MIQSILMLLATAALIFRLAWGIKTKLRWPAAEIMATVSLLLCALFPFGLALSSRILNRDDGSETQWIASGNVLGISFFLIALAMLLGIVGTFTAMFRYLLHPKPIAPALVAIVSCVAALSISFGEYVCTFGLGHPGHIAADEAMAVNSLRKLYAENLKYSTDHPGQYAPSMAELRKQSQEQISSALANGKTYGYHFTYTATTTKKNGALDGFRVTAEPLILYTSGNRYFFVDQSGIIRYDDKYPTEASPPLD